MLECDALQSLVCSSFRIIAIVDVTIKLFVELDPRNQVCINGVLGDDNFTCVCSPGYTGSICDVPLITECDVNPCQNGGNCSMVASTPVCACPEGLNRPTCSTTSKLQVGV